MKTSHFRDLCREYGISAKTGYKWKQRFLERGLGGLQEESRRPRGHPSELSEEVVCEIVRLKTAHSRWGPRKIRDLYERGTLPVYGPLKVRGFGFIDSGCHLLVNLLPERRPEAAA